LSNSSIVAEKEEDIMSSKRNVPLFMVLLLSFALASLNWVPAVMAAEYLEEFDDPTLNTELWDMKAEGAASYKIEDGQLTMTSPGVEDGILLYWKGSEISKEDFTIEIKASVAANTNNAGVIAFIREELPPTLNTTINAEWKNMFWCGTNTPGWYINDDNWSRAGAQGPEFEGIWKAEIKGNVINCYFNDDKVVTIDKVQEDRYLCFGPDTYTSHYSGEMTIDWIRLSGSSVPATAVEPAQKIWAQWGEIKGEF
jgi:hypothetical protein